MNAETTRISRIVIEACRSMFAVAFVLSQPVDHLPHPRAQAMAVALAAASFGA